MKIDTTTILIAGAAVVGVYLLTRPKVPVQQVAAYNPYGSAAYNPYGSNPALLQQANPTAQIISASGTALDGLSNLIGNFF